LSYIVYKGRGLGKRYGIKCGAIGEEIEEHMRTLGIQQGMSLEITGNMVGTSKL
jgi:hypothetical protein